MRRFRSFVHGFPLSNQYSTLGDCADPKRATCLGAPGHSSDESGALRQKALGDPHAVGLRRDYGFDPIPDRQSAPLRPVRSRRRFVMSTTLPRMETVHFRGVEFSTLTDRLRVCAANLNLRLSESDGGGLSFASPRSVIQFTPEKRQIRLGEKKFGKVRISK